jgi:hypothetical protein
MHAFAVLTAALGTWEEQRGHCTVEVICSREGEWAALKKDKSSRRFVIRTCSTPVVRVSRSTAPSMECMLRDSVKVVVTSHPYKVQLQSRLPTSCAGCLIHSRWQWSR